MIGVRYVHARRGNYFSKLISYVSIIGMALGVAVLLTIISIMNGFESEIRERVLGLDGHIEIETVGAAALEQGKLINLIKSSQVEAEVWPTISRDVLLQSGRSLLSAEIRSSNVHMQSVQRDLLTFLREGKSLTTSSNPFSIVIGSELASQLGVGVGELVTVISPDPRVTSLGLSPRTKRFEVAGIFEVGLGSSDSRLAFIKETDAARFFRIDETYDRLEIRLADATKASDFAETIRGSVNYPVRDWTELHGGLFQALKTEKFLMFVLLAIAAVIALFNVVSILIVSIDEKKKDMKILFSMGLTPNSIVGVFLVQGIITGMIGVVFGVLLGYFLASNISEVVSHLENILHFKIFPPEIFYISEIPSVLLFSDFLVVTVVASFLSVLTPFYPALRVAKQSRVWRESL